MADRVRIAVVGAGLIGARHAEAIRVAEHAELACIVDPAPVGAEVAKRHDVPRYKSLEEMFAADGIDGVFLATPNQVHVEHGLKVIEAGLPMLIEKPLATDLTGGVRLVEAAEAAGVAMAVGHHRRHNPLIAKAKEQIDAGALGKIATVHGTTWFLKPDHYFDTEWRRKKGAGPVYLNLIHDIDLMRHLCGPIAEVQAMESNAVRGNEVEETAVILLRFASGALGTVNVCDAAAAPWSWEMTARENQTYPATPEDCYWIGGTQGSLSLPNLALWRHEGELSWWAPISATKMIFDIADPLVRQADQFAAMVRDGAAPLVSGRDGLAALEVIEAVKTAARTHAPVKLILQGSP